MESIKQITDRYSHNDESMNEYLVRIGAKNNTPKIETFDRFDDMKVN